MQQNNFAVNEVFNAYVRGEAQKFAASCCNRLSYLAKVFPLFAIADMLKDK